MKGLFFALIALVVILWVVTWVISHSFLVVSVGPVLLVLFTAFIILFLYIHFQTRRK